MTSERGRSKRIAAIVSAALLLGVAAGYFYSYNLIGQRTATETTTLTAISVSTLTVTSLSTLTSTNTGTSPTESTFITFVQSPSLRLSLSWNGSSIDEYGEAFSVNESVMNDGLAPVTILPIQLSSPVVVADPSNRVLAGTGIPIGGPGNINLNAGQQITYAFTVSFLSPNSNATGVGPGRIAQTFFMSVVASENGIYSMIFSGHFTFTTPYTNLQRIISIPITVNIQ